MKRLFYTSLLCLAAQSCSNFDSSTDESAKKTADQGKTLTQLEIKEIEQVWTVPLQKAHNKPKTVVVKQEKTLDLANVITKKVSKKQLKKTSENSVATSEGMLALDAAIARALADRIPKEETPVVVEEAISLPIVIEFNENATEKEAEKPAVKALSSVGSIYDKAVKSWELQWSDEFNGTELDAEKWFVLNRYHAKKRNLFYSNREENVRVDNGILILEAHEDNIENPLKGKAWKKSLEKDIRFTQDTVKYTSGRIQTAHRGQFKAKFKYGKIDARVRLPKTLGTHAAIWTMGESFYKRGYGWPKAGEIDILEYIAADSTKAWNVLHYANSEGKHVGQNNKGMNPFGKKSLANGDFHTVSVEWDEQEIRYFLDGKLSYYFEVSQANGAASNPFMQNHFLIFDLALGGWGGEVDTDNLPARMEIDWVRYYTR